MENIKKTYTSNMLKIKRKRIELVLFAVITSVTMVSIKTNNIQNQEVVKETTATPATGKIVVLDAGHGGEDGGATGSNGTTEAELNLQITLKVQKLLEQNGTTVILTRSNENAIYDLDAKTLKQKKVSDIKNRVKIGNSSSADIFVSIHLNKIPQQQYYGWQCFYKDKNEQSEKLAKSIQNSLNEAIQKENNRLAMKINNIYIVKNVEIPISIVECGFLSNPQEEQELQQEEYQNRIAWGIYTGICEYFST